MGIGILFIVAASLLFGFVPSINKFVMLDGVPAASVTFFSQSILVITSFILIKIKGERMHVAGKDLIQMLLLGAVGMGGTGFLIAQSCTLIPVGLATVLHFLYPTLVSVVMILMFGQKMTVFKALAIVSSISGMILIANPGGEGFAVLGIVLALCSSMTYSFYIISNDVSSVNNYPQLVKLFYSALGSAALFGMISIGSGSFKLPSTAGASAAMIFSGLCSFSAFLCINLGIRIVGASVASFVNMLEPITSVVVSFIMYHDDLTTAMLIGIALVLLAVFLVAMSDMRAQKAEA